MEITGTAIIAAENPEKTTEASSPTRLCGTTSMIATTRPWTRSRGPCENRLLGRSPCTPKQKGGSYQEESSGALSALKANCKTKDGKQRVLFVRSVLCTDRLHIQRGDNDQYGFS